MKGSAAEGATRSNTEAQGAGLDGAMKGSAAEGATRSNTEAQGAGLGVAVKGKAAKDESSGDSKAGTSGGSEAEEDTNGSYSYPLVGPRPEEAPPTATTAQ